MKFKTDILADAEIFASGERDDKDTFLALYYQKLKTVLEYNELNWRSIQRGLPC